MVDANGRDLANSFSKLLFFRRDEGVPYYEWYVVSGRASAGNRPIEILLPRLD
jgi:hypothetical protein